MTTVQRGDHFEFFNAAMDSVTEYELERFEDIGTAGGALAFLRNVETDGLAQVYLRSLLRPPSTGASHWRKVEA